MQQRKIIQMKTDAFGLRKVKIIQNFLWEFISENWIFIYIHILLFWRMVEKNIS